MILKNGHHFFNFQLCNIFFMDFERTRRKSCVDDKEIDRNFGNLNQGLCFLYFQKR